MEFEQNAGNKVKEIKIRGPVMVGVFFIFSPENKVPKLSKLHIKHYIGNANV